MNISKLHHITFAGASWRDYLGLCKPKVVLVMLLTVLVGMLLAMDLVMRMSGGMLLVSTLGTACTLRIG